MLVSLVRCACVREQQLGESSWVVGCGSVAQHHDGWFGSWSVRPQAGYAAALAGAGCCTPWWTIALCVSRQRSSPVRVATVTAPVTPLPGLLPECDQDGSK